MVIASPAALQSPAAVATGVAVTAGAAAVVGAVVSSASTGSALAEGTVNATKAAPAASIPSADRRITVLESIMGKLSFFPWFPATPMTVTGPLPMTSRRLPVLLLV